MTGKKMHSAREFPKVIGERYQVIWEEDAVSEIG